MTQSLSRAVLATRPVLIMVAPTGARRMPRDHAALPITLDAIAETAADCFAAGAGAIHAHVRDAAGAHLLDVAAYRAQLARIAVAAPDIVVQVTTEAVGRYSPADQAALLTELRPRFVSVAIREFFADAEAPAAAALLAAQASGVACQYIVYDDRDLVWFSDLVARGLLPGTRHRIIVVMGRYTEGQNSDIAEFAARLATMDRLGLTDTTVWTVCAFGQGETAVLEAAMAAGGHMRVGFENSLLHADGRVAADNRERVAAIATLARGMGRPLAFGAQAAAILGGSSVA
ncbi:BKACE family enzyme [Lichenifustis flavocetrariae]|uniref:3-keto-5-aminohexanoate cleavage protein n=1 Tax=Lichenifustis flavocetrariae TaxID=2949735 RepID=A0AA41Z8E3_9HYPH|nr:3-keto-5-aminohexanoate cleavage protein [Lichenifustis flavocetrariae]MCW6511187.1 3-keto-5-aminohexanoate cleavage protein [Lichenifustis flavocetrariae]